MARVTIEDCLVQIPSPFTLASVAAKRARQLARGAESRLPWDGHKSTVLALQEIAHGKVNADILDEADLPVAPRPEQQFDVLDPHFK